MSAFDFWLIAFNAGWADVDILKQVVKTEKNPFGEITEEEYKLIVGEETGVEKNE